MDYANKLIGFLQDIEYIKTIKQSGYVEDVNDMDRDPNIEIKYEEFTAKWRGILNKNTFNDNWKEDRLNYLENKYK